MTELVTHTLTVPGAVLHYDVRHHQAGAGPPLLLVGSPMDAAGFGTLAGHFDDRTVVTYDPRGVARSVLTDGATVTTPDQHADDLNGLVTQLGSELGNELGNGPVDVFASSGGAVNALAWAARHPEQIRTLVAHEPPAAQQLPDREQALAACQDIHDTYQRSGAGPAMAKFIAVAAHKGPVPGDFADQRFPDPADFGLPSEDDGSRNDPLLGLNLVSCTHYEHDFEALRRASGASVRIVIAVGAGSQDELAHRAGVAVAERLGTPVCTFPGDHGGFLGGEYGMTGEPDAFAKTLRQVLATDG